MKSQTLCRVKSRQEDWSSGAPARKKRTQYSRPAVRRRDRRRADGMRDAQMSTQRAAKCLVFSGSLPRSSERPAWLSPRTPYWNHVNLHGVE